METWDALRARRNVRKFTAQPLPEEALDRILEAGRRAPSAGNWQPWDFVLVTDRTQLVELAKVWQGAGHVAGAAAALAVTRPDLGRRSTALADRLLQRGRLAGTGRFLSTDPTRPERFFRRRSCCLFYRVPGGGTCADCVLNEITAPRPVTPRRE